MEQEPDGGDGMEKETDQWDGVGFAIVGEQSVMSDFGKTARKQVPAEAAEKLEAR